MIKHKDNWSYFNITGYKLEDFTLELDEFFEQIGVPKYEERPYEFYKSKGFQLEELEFILAKTPLQVFYKYILFAGYEFKLVEQKQKKQSVYKKEDLNKAEMLLFLRKITASKENKDVIIEVHSNEKDKFKTKYKVQSKAIANELKLVLMEYFKKEHKMKFNVDNLDNRIIIEFIADERRKIIKRGKPQKNNSIAQFAENLLFMIYHDSAISNKVEKFTNRDCRLIHDCLSYFEIIEDKSRKKLRAKDELSYVKVSRHNYIRTLINNYRKQKNNQKEN